MVTPPITALANELEGIGLGSFFSDRNVPQNPSGSEIQTILSQLNQSNWLKLPFPYTFSVVNIANPALNSTNRVNATGGFTDFPLPLAPSDLTQDEEFSINVKPTQGGTVVNHSGNRYKTLTVKGTTGLSPFRGATGSSIRTGEVFFAPAGIKYKSGYEVFLRLRNWFKAYYEYKKVNPREAQDLRLIFKNFKDGEFLVVELLKFKLVRTAKESFLYNYDLEFKVLGHRKFEDAFSGILAEIEKGIDIATDVIEGARRTMLKSQAIIRQVESTTDAVVNEPLRRVSLALKALAGVPTTAQDVGSSIKAETMRVGDIKASLDEIKAIRPNDSNLPEDTEQAAKSQGVDVFKRIGDAAMDVPASDLPEKTRNAHTVELQQSLQTPRFFYENLKVDLKRIRKNLEDWLNVGDSSLDTIFDRTQTFNSDNPLKQPTFEEYEVLFAFQQAVEGIDALLATEDLFKSTLDERIADMISRFSGNIQLFSTSAVREYRVTSGATLERIAQEELGDSTRWGEIAEINNLKAPFITNDKSSTASNVAKVGDILLLPTSPSFGFNQLPSAKEIKSTKGLSELERSFGTDLLLSDSRDLVLTPNQDFELVSGRDNLLQAANVKVEYEPGDVIRHPAIGAGIQPGQKFPSFEDIQEGILNTLLSDPRIDRLSDIILKRENSGLYINLVIHPKNVDIPVPFIYKLGDF